jgi:hypothetical protein
MDVQRGFALPPRRRESSLILVQSDRISASFFARLHPLIWRSTAIPSVILSKYSDQARTTGRLEKVYPGYDPALC